jgi:hypothetical protein
MTDTTTAAFLDGPPSLPTLQQAATIARHLVDCNDCARLLTSKHEHYAFLLRALEQEQPADVLDVGADDPVVQAQAELRVWADAIARTIDQDLARAIERSGGPVSRSHLRTLGTLDPVRYRFALAVAQVALELQGQVLRSSNRSGVLGSDGSLQLQSSLVPSEYFAGCIAERCAIPEDLAARLWAVITRQAVEGRVGLPRLAASWRGTNDEVRLQFDQSVRARQSESPRMNEDRRR